MTPRIPKRLRREPLIEAIWEMRFENSARTPLANVLPGFLYQRFRHAFPKIVNLPAVNIPHFIVQEDPQLRYVPIVRIEGGQAESSALALQVGERVVSLHCSRPYVGWAVFSRRIAEVANALQEFGLIDRPQRFSLRYLDLIDLEPQPSLKGLTAQLRLGDLELAQRPLQLRTEIHEQSLICIIQITSATEARITPSQPLSGVLVDIDVICAENDHFWESFTARLERVHDWSKRVFFSLLEPQTIERLEPVYD